MLIVGKTYLFQTLTYWYSGRVVEHNPGHATLADVMIHLEDVGDLSEFRRGVGKYARLPHGYVVALPGTGIMPLEDVGIR
jgi:hypothetical protein